MAWLMHFITYPRLCMDGGIGVSKEQGRCLYIIKQSIRPIWGLTMLPRSMSSSSADLAQIIALYRPASFLKPNGERVISAQNFQNEPDPPFRVLIRPK